jgi:hypothetical protein
MAIWGLVESDPGRSDQIDNWAMLLESIMDAFPDAADDEIVGAILSIDPQLLAQERTTLSAVHLLTPVYADPKREIPGWIDFALRIFRIVEALPPFSTPDFQAFQKIAEN